MGGMVFYINLDESFEGAVYAALKQAVYTFFLGGICVRLSENVAVQTKNAYWGVIKGTILASFVTITSVYAIHSFKGTPKPLLSTLPTAILAPPGFIVLAGFRRYKYEKEEEKVYVSSL